MKLIFLGAPGAGKGTQAGIISKRLGIPTISTGNILRAAAKNGTPTGILAKSYMEEGELVPDEVIIQIVDERLAEADCANGYILDGVPRTIVQAEALEAAGINFDLVISIEITDEEIVQRISGRRTCSDCHKTCHVVNAPPQQEGICDACGGELMLREDDKPEKVLARLKIYHRETAPLKEFYTKRGVLKSIQNQPTIEKATQAVLAVMGETAMESA